MANKIYPSGNYLIIEPDGADLIQWNQVDIVCKENTTQFSIFRKDKKEATHVILFSESAEWEDNAVTAYDTGTLRTMLRANTGSLNS